MFELRQMLDMSIKPPSFTDMPPILKIGGSLSTSVCVIAVGLEDERSIEEWLFSSASAPAVASDPEAPGSHLKPRPPYIYNSLKPRDNSRDNP